MKSKQEEIDQFLRFQKRCEKGGYLDGILRGLENYVESQIRNDFAVPAMEYVNQASDTIDKALMAQRKAENLLGFEELKVKNAREVIEAAKKREADFENQLFEAEKTAEGYRRDLAEEGDRLIAERLKMSELGKELTKVKAANFDRIQAVLDEFHESLETMRSQFKIGAVLKSKKLK